jgi:short-subunit dehydrogenase
MKTSYILKEHEEAIFLPLDQLDLNDWAPADQTFLVALRERYQKTFTLITGATGVLGAEFALLCAARGENLYLTGRSEQKLQECKEHILACYPEVEVMLCACDLVDEHSREKLMQDAEGLRFARLINVAGADIQKPFADYTQEKLTFQTRVCFEGAVSMCHFALSHRADRLRILNISSVSGIYPMPYFAIYSAAKAALTQFSVAIAREVKGENVSVTVVLPGAIYTRPDVVEYIKTQGLWGRLAAKSPSYVAQKALQLSDKGRRKAVIGFANKCMAFFTRLVPEGIRLRYIAKRWKRTTKDAF